MIYMFDAKNERPIVIAVAAAEVGVSVETVRNWILRGIKPARAGGDRIKLEAVRLGGKLATSRESLARFLEATTGSAAPNRKERHESAEAAKSRLRAMGVMK